MDKELITEEQGFKLYVAQDDDPGSPAIIQKKYKEKV